MVHTIRPQHIALSLPQAHQRAAQPILRPLSIYHRTPKTFLSSKNPLYENIRTHLTELIQVADPRAKDSRMKEAIAVEIRDLVRRGTFKVVMREEIPPNANVLTARFVLAIKHKISCEVRFKAIYVIGGTVIGWKKFWCMAHSFCSQSVFVCLWHLLQYLISKFGPLMRNWLTYRLMNHFNANIHQRSCCGIWSWRRHGTATYQIFL